MTDSVIQDSLRRLPHFGALPKDLLAKVAHLCRLRALRRGEMLFAEGEPCRAFFAVRRGAIQLHRLSPEGRERVVHRLGPGASFAEAALLSFGRYPVSAVATEDDTELLEVGGEGFLALLRADERLAPAMLSSLCIRLSSLVERVEELSLVQASERLARWLLRQPSSGPQGRLAVELALTKQQLAARLAMTPETLSRLLRRFQDEGWIESERGRVVVLDVARLGELAGEPPDA